MSKEPLPAEVRSAVAAHLEEKHGLPLDEDEVGMRAAKRNLQIVWHRGGEEEGASFRCRRCPEGFDRYFVEVEALVPSDRILECIRAHFRRAHGDRRLAAGALYYAGNDAEESVAIFMPMLASRGAGILCRRCSSDGQPVIVTDPPYGDARRLRYQLQTQNRWSEVATLPPREQAEYLEALDRGLLQELQQSEARQALRIFQRREPSPAGDGFTRALQRMLLERVRAGDSISRLLKRVERDSKERPARLARLLAPYAGVSASSIETMAPTELRRLVARRLGFADERLPRLGERRLWAIWRDAKPTGLR